MPRAGAELDSRRLHHESPVSTNPGFFVPAALDHICRRVRGATRASSRYLALVTQSASYEPHSDERSDDVLENPNTIFVAGGDDVVYRLETQLRQQGRAIAASLDAEPQHQGDVAARVVLVAGWTHSVHELPASPDSYFVVGRHTDATVRAENAPSLSLRHVLLIPQRPETGHGCMLDIVALLPTEPVRPWPLLLPAELRTRCSALLLGDAVLLIAPEAKSSSPSTLHLTPEPAARLVTRPRPRPPDETSVVSRITTASSVEDLDDGDDDGHDDAGLVLEVRGAEHSARINLREAWLVGGIVLGRKEDKCSCASFARILEDQGVSRCHLFVRRERDDIVFYDTGSSWGISLTDHAEDRTGVIRRLAVSMPRDGREPRTARTSLYLTSDVVVTLYARPS